MVTKESIYELQKIDCNCNDCKHLVRNLYRQEIQNQFHRNLQWDEYSREREKELSEAYIFRDCTVLNKLIKQVFKPTKPNMSYGNCKRFDFKEVSFIPNTCQLDTQQCFEHRK